MCRQRFLPSEFGMDPARMREAIEPGRVTFDEKMKVREAIETSDIPFTYVCGSCFAGYFVPNLSQMTTLTPPNNNLFIYGDGNSKAVFMDEDDIATYTIKTVDDPRTLNKTVYLRPPENILSQRQLVDMWENLSGQTLEEIVISKEDFLASMKGECMFLIIDLILIYEFDNNYVCIDMDYAGQVGVGHFYHIFYEGCLTNYEAEEGQEEASELYPEVKYVRMEEYLKQFL